MDLVRSGVILLLAGFAAVAYLWLSVKYKYSPTSRPQSKVREQSAEESPPERKQNRSRQPLEILYPGPTDDTNAEAEVDIIAVHGLGSNVDWSWTWKDGDKHINWLRDPDMLPAKVPKSRIIVYNYESKWHADAPKTRLQLCGEELVHSIHSFRGDASNRPIVFVGHSLGGNVIVHGLLYADSEDRFRYLPEVTVGLAFLGTPLRGTTWQPFADSAAGLMQPAGSHRGIIRELDFDEPVLLDKLHSFCRLRNRLSTPVSCFSELYETDYGRRFGIPGLAKGMVVKEASACIPGLDRYALQTDHLKINKYSGPTDRSFLRVSAKISEMCANAKDVVRRRQDPNPIITDSRYALTKKPEARDCLHELFLTDPFEDRNALKRKKGNRAPGTCDWILGTGELTAWLGFEQTADPESQTSHLLWLHGNPGTGKSTMAIFLTEELSSAFAATDGKTLVYFFCDSGFEKRKTATSVVRGLLLQLVQQHPQLLDYLLPKYNERGAELFKSFDALWPIFMAAAADEKTGRKYCIIDALDECDRESQKILLQQFRETFQSRNVRSNIRILVTSRPYPEIQEYLERFANKDLASFPETKQDIDRCIEERVVDLAKRKRYTPKVKGQVSDILRDKAEGTFIWVGLACEELEDVLSKDAVQVLQNMPKGLHSLYKRLLDTALKQEWAEPDVIWRILRFVAVGLQPLSVLELSEICQLHQEEEDVKTRVQFTREQIASCRLMVIIQDEKVLLLHKSVKDYLVGDDSDHFIDELKAHAYVSYRCIDLLIKQLSYDLSSDDEGSSEYPILFWMDHARLADSALEVVNFEAEELFQPVSNIREKWFYIYWSKTHEYESRPNDFTTLHVAAFAGIVPLVKSQFRAEKFEVNEKDTLGRTPLSWAAENGHEAVVKLLLEKGAELENKDTEYGQTPLSLAAKNGYEAIVKLLLEKGAKLENKANNGQTPLPWAVSNDHEEVVKLLLEKGAELENKADNGWTPLLWAAENVYEAVVKLLLEKGAELESKANNGQTPLSWAARFGHEAIVKLLLEKGAELENKANNGQTPLSWAAENGYEAVVKLLLENGAELENKDTLGQTPLSRAAENGYEAVVKLLLEKGAEKPQS